MKSFFLALGLGLLVCSVSCTTTRAKRFADVLDPMIGSGKKVELDSLLGRSVSCTAEGQESVCEYRTARMRNYPVPDAARRLDSSVPDLSPFEYFDVVLVRYDGFGVLKEWQLQPNPESPY